MPEIKKKKIATTINAMQSWVTAAWPLGTQSAPATLEERLEVLGEWNK